MFWMILSLSWNMWNMHTHTHTITYKHHTLTQSNLKINISSQNSLPVTLNFLLSAISQPREGWRTTDNWSSLFWCCFLWHLRQSQVFSSNTAQVDRGWLLISPMNIAPGTAAKPFLQWSLQLSGDPSQHFKSPACVLLWSLLCANSVVLWPVKIMIPFALWSVIWPDSGFLLLGLSSQGIKLSWWYTWTCDVFDHGNKNTDSS